MVQPKEAIPFRFSTDSFPERERLAFFREELARQVLRLDVEPLDDQPFHAELTSFALTDFRMFRCKSSALLFDRTKNLIPSDEGSVGLVFAIGGPAMLLQRGQEVMMTPGDAVVISHHDPAQLTRSTGQHCGMVISSTKLATMTGDVEATYARRIPHDNEALRLLVQYLGILREDMTNASAELRRTVTAHIHDLVALAIGATRDGGAIAVGRGVRAARLHAVRADILADLTNPHLSVTLIARRQGITPRYLHMLFEATEISFSQFVLRERLALARGMLSDRSRDHMTIMAIALAAGFSDLSYFNHAFRDRYGATPRELRWDRARPNFRS